MRFNNLQAWLNWQETLNPKEIDLGLERISQVLQRMGLSSRFDCPLIMVAGTNGKGSVVAMLESIALAAGLNVCAYTSPHIISYNERLKIKGTLIDDDSLCQAFERIDQARGEDHLTYFEFGTLAAIDLFKRAQADLVVMEVGLGGRLDAVNVMEPDVSVITPIAIDHVDWLGDNREDIAREKAGILREGGVAVCGDPDPPDSLLNLAEQKSVEFYRLGLEFSASPQDMSQARQESAPQWNFSSQFGDLNNLPLPKLSGRFQLDNAASAILALQVLQDLMKERDVQLEVTEAIIRKGLMNVRLGGRYEVLQQQPLVIADVAHNPHAIAALVDQLQASPVAGKTHVVVAMLADKPVQEVVQCLFPVADCWYTAGLESVMRGLSSKDMSAAVASLHTDVKLCEESTTVEEALAKALDSAEQQDRIVITGSFYTVASATQYFHRRTHLA